MSRIATYSAIALLSAFQLWWGLVPAFTRIDTDFPNYYVASRLVIERSDLSLLYDDSWFQEEIRSHGINQEGRFTPFPPATAFVMIPVAFLSPLNALRAWTVVNIGLAAAVILLIAKISGKGLRWSALLLLITGVGLANNVRFGQLYLLVAADLLLGLLLYRDRRPGLAGFVWGLGASIKYLPAVLLLHCLVRREWRAVGAGAAAIAGVYLLSGLALGNGVMERWLTVVLPGHLGAELPEPANPVYQSWPSLLHRIFLGMPLAYRIGVATISATLVGILAATYRHTWRRDPSGLSAMALLFLCAMTLLPASATYHYILLVVPMAILVTRVPDGIWTRAALACTALVGFIPYSLFYRAGAVLAPLAYPRLWLVTALYGIAVAGVWLSTQRETETAVRAV